MNTDTVDILHKMVKDVEVINRLFAQFLDTLSFEESSRLVLLEKLR